MFVNCQICSATKQTWFQVTFLNRRLAGFVAILFWFSNLVAMYCSVLSPWFLAINDLNKVYCSFTQDQTTYRTAFLCSISIDFWLQDIMEWFNGLMVKDSDALAAGYETTIKTDAFKKGASAKAAAPTPSPKKKVVKKAGFSLPFGKK